MGSSDYPGNIFAIELDQNPVYGDGNVDSRRPWDLKHGASYSCSIQERDTNIVVVIIEKYVTRYGQNGFLADLPELNVGRFALTCGGYYQDDGTKVMLVAGGDDDGSVEIRRGDGDAPWVMTTPLPIIKNYNINEWAQIATLNNVLYHTGNIIDEVFKKSQILFLKGAETKMEDGIMRSSNGMTQTKSGFRWKT